MNISILSVFPELYTSFLQTSLVKRAQDSGSVAFNVARFASFSPVKKRIDAPTFGHGAGMLLKPDVVEAAFESATRKHGRPYTIFLSPQGKKLDQPLVKKIANKSMEAGHLMLVASRYEGMDARVEQEYADEVISIGDYVLMGGDLPAMVLLEAVMRYIPGVVGRMASVEEESFSGPFVEYDQYTEPVEWRSRRVPDVMRSGNHKAIEQWQQDNAVRKTIAKNFAWLRSSPLSEEQRERAYGCMPSHYAVLMHGDVVIGPDRVEGTTSVTSIDIHDIARSAKTFGMKGYFIVTPLADQQRMVEKLLGFWQTGVGIEYNKSRHEALSHVSLQENIHGVIAAIEEKEGKKPILVATSALDQKHAQRITYHDQARVWAHDRPVLFVFGTGKGLSDKLIELCDYFLVPLEGFSTFNHLSVRSAAALIFDRWLGLNPKR